MEYPQKREAGVILPFKMRLLSVESIVIEKCEGTHSQRQLRHSRMIDLLDAPHQALKDMSTKSEKGI